MTPAEAFKFGFLSKCAADGCTPQQVEARIRAVAMTKTAWPDPVTPTLEAGKSAIGWTLPKVLTFLLAAPPAIGALGGYAAAKATADDFNPKDTLQHEELDNYYQAIRTLSQVEKKQRQRLLAQGR